MKQGMNSDKYKELLKALRREAKKTNTKVTIRYREKSSDADHGVEGSFDFHVNRIKITAYGKNPRIYVLAVLAHEIRHAQHFAENLYPDYYDYDRFYNDSISESLRINPYSIKLPNLRTGQHAENDCNAFAIKWLQSFGFKINDFPSISFLTRPYAIEGLANFDFYDKIKKERKSFKSNL
jgi:hypothetical protein